MILDSILSVFTGGATGLAGSAISIWGASKKHKYDMQEKELELKRIQVEGDEERKMVTLENEFRDRVNVRDNEQKIIANDTDLLKTAIRSDKATYSTGVVASLEHLGEGNVFASTVAVLTLAGLSFVDVVRGLLRPVATAYLLYQVSFLEGDKATEAVIFLSTMAVSFYFGSRSLGKVFKGGK